MNVIETNETTNTDKISSHSLDLSATSLSAVIFRMMPKIYI